MTFPERAGVSTIVRNTKPGPPESESLVGQVPAVKSEVVPAHSSKFVPAVVFSKDSFNTAAVVVATGEPVTRYLPVVPTVPVMVVEASALPSEAAKSAADGKRPNNFLNIFILLFCN